MANRLDIALKEADHVQTILARYDQGFVTIKTAYAVCVATILVNTAIDLTSWEKVIALAICAGFFGGFEFCLRLRYWSSWAFRISKLSDVLVRRTGFYWLIGTDGRNGATELRKPTLCWRFQVAHSWPDWWYYGVSLIGASIFVLMQGS